MDTHWCHQCQRECRPVRITTTSASIVTTASQSADDNEPPEIVPTSESSMATTLQCPRCRSDFLEELGEQDLATFQPDVFTEQPGGGAGTAIDLMGMIQTALGQLLPQTQGQWPMPAATATDEDEPPEPVAGTTDDEGEEDGQRGPRVTRGQFGPIQFTFASINGNNFQQAQQQPPQDFNELLRMLFSMTGGPAAGPMNQDFFRMMGLQGNAGDYVFGQQELDDIISRLMEQTAGRNAPPPASDELLQKLPRKRITEKEKSDKLECAICKEEFEFQEEVVELPCHHVFHDPCAHHWLKINGTCPVCRFSIIETSSPPETPAPS